MDSQRPVEDKEYFKELFGFDPEETERSNPTDEADDDILPDELLNFNEDTAEHLPSLTLFPSYKDGKKRFTGSSDEPNRFCFVDDKSDVPKGLEIFEMDTGKGRTSKRLVVVHNKITKFIQTKGRINTVEKKAEEKRKLLAGECYTGDFFDYYEYGTDKKVPRSKMYIEGKRSKYVMDGANKIYIQRKDHATNTIKNRKKKQVLAEDEPVKHRVSNKRQKKKAQSTDMTAQQPPVTMNFGNQDFDDDHPFKLNLQESPPSIEDQFPPPLNLEPIDSFNPVASKDLEETENLLGLSNPEENKPNSVSDDKIASPLPDTTEQTKDIHQVCLELFNHALDSSSLPFVLILWKQHKVLLCKAVASIDPVTQLDISIKVFNLSLEFFHIYVEAVEHHPQVLSECLTLLTNMEPYPNILAVREMLIKKLGLSQALQQGPVTNHTSVYGTFGLYSHNNSFVPHPTSAQQPFVPQSFFK